MWYIVVISAHLKEYICACAGKFHNRHDIPVQDTLYIYVRMYVCMYVFL